MAGRYRGFFFVFSSSSTTAPAAGPVPSRQITSLDLFQGICKGIQGFISGQGFIVFQPSPKLQHGDGHHLVYKFAVLLPVQQVEPDILEDLSDS